MPLFEGYERRIDKINVVLKQYGFESIEDAVKLCNDKGIDVIKLIKDRGNIKIFTSGINIRFKKIDKKFIW